MLWPPLCWDLQVCSLLVFAVANTLLLQAIPTLAVSPSPEPKAVCGDICPLAQVTLMFWAKL